MRLTKLILEQFRNYPHLEINFDALESMTYIVGPNAQGKTNILESIYLLALTKSFRTAHQQEMIGWGHEYARVKGVFENDPDGGTEKIMLEAFLGFPPNPQKVFKIDDGKVSASNFIGNCQVVFFHPEDLNMLYLGPDLRRAYINTMNVQVSRKYFGALRSYHKVLKQRNALLRALKIDRNANQTDGENMTDVSIDQLDVWDEQLVEYGSYLMLERANTIEYFQEHLAETYQKISRGDEKVSIRYQHTLNFFPENETAVPKLEAWQNHFSRSLSNARARDLQAMITTVGPHRDELGFSFNGLVLSATASRGEYRSLLLALKLIELKFFEKSTGRRPLLLLDDVFSELDDNRQNLLLQAITGHQTIVTTTNIHSDAKRTQRVHRGLQLRPGKLLEIHQGTVV